MTFYVEGLKRSGPAGTIHHIGNYEKLDDAIAAAKRTVDSFLMHEYSPGTSSEVLFAVYENLGEFPYIFRDDDRTVNVPEFNHLQYAMAECAEFCEGRRTPAQSRNARPGGDIVTA
jgi:hypothetical protein